MKCSQPISSPVSSKMAAAPCSTSRSKARPAAGLAVSPLVASEPPQIVPTTSSLTSIGSAGACASARASRRTHALPASMRRPRAARLLDHQRLDRPARVADGRRQAAAVEALASQRDQEHAAHVRVRAKLLHDPRRIGIGKTAGKADQVHAPARETGRRFPGPRDGHIPPGRPPPARCESPCGRRISENRPSAVLQF